MAELMTIAEWVDSTYKPERLNRDSGSRGRIIADREADVQTLGHSLISRHESRTGEAVWYPCNPYAEKRMANQEVRGDA